MRPIEPKFRYIRLSDVQKRRILEKLKKELERLDKIVFVYVHGGFVERNIFRDLDLALWIEDLSGILKYEIDFSVKLSTKIGIPVDVQILNEAPLPFKYRVFTKGELILSRNEGLRTKIVDLTCRQYLDLKEFLKK